jgi:PEP-CTERM motif
MTVMKMTIVKRITHAARLGVAMLIGFSLCAPLARADYITTLVQQGNDVVATGSGTLNLASLSIIPGTFSSDPSMQPKIGLLFIGEPADAFISGYTGVTGPTGFGNGNLDISANGGTGDLVGIDETTPFGLRAIIVPEGYVSGSALFESSTWNNQSFSSLGVTPGNYEWTWGSGADADSFTLDIESNVVPEPPSLLLFGVGLAALTLWRTSRRISA